MDGLALVDWLVLRLVVGLRLGSDGRTAMLMEKKKKKIRTLPYPYHNPLQ